MANESINSNQTPSIPEWFRNRNILLTGGTGFLGKVLMIKLLQSCPDIGKIYLLIREKRGMDPHTRLQQIFKEEAFKELRENQPDKLKKLVVVSGDSSLEGLGLSKSDYNIIIDQVSVIIHMAANVKFNVALKTIVNDNTRATNKIIALAKQVPKLVSFIYVSTAFSNCGEEVLEERAYPTVISPEKIMSLVDIIDEDMLEMISPKLLRDAPNGYSFSKSLCEDLVTRSGLPAGIARPSLVIPCWKEPVPGWVDNTNGITGVIIGAGKGVIRSMMCNGDHLCEMIPCDLVVNAIIGQTWQVGLKQPKEPIFINMTQSEENPITWRYALETGKKHALTNPFSGPLWYPGGDITTWKIVHWFSVILFHLLPAYFVDTLCILTGNKPFLVKIQSRVSAGLGLIHYYTTKRWKFRNEGMKSLYNELNSSDKEKFYMDINAVSWDDYLLHYILGTRRYCLKEDPSTLPRARKVFFYLYIAHNIVKLAFIILFAWMFISWIIPLSTTIVNTYVEVL